MAAPAAPARVVVVVPAYRVEREIGAVLRELPPWVQHVVVVDDASDDGTGAAVEAVGDARVELLRHPTNRGVGGAMRSGFARALELRADVVVKMDGDGQMDPRALPELVAPLLRGEADYTKGNRFRDLTALADMPPLRRAGNMALSFLVKAATGYWHCFDPTNGFVAIRGEVLAALPLGRVDRSYYFETSMLERLYLLGAVVRDVPIPARYGSERSQLSIPRVLVEFPARLARGLVRRLVLKNFLYDFGMESVYLLLGVPMLAFGVLYGGINWVRYARAGVGAPVGTVMVAALLVLLGFQLLLSAVAIDLASEPSEPLCRGRLPEVEPGQPSGQSPSSA